MKVFAIGDIHGCLKELLSLHNKILNHSDFNKDEDLLLYIGDYIDRGPNSQGVIDEIISLKKENIKTVFLIGNHEQVMVDFLLNKINNLDYWLNLGADKTLYSYGIEVAEFIKDGFEDNIQEKLRNAFLNKISREHIHFYQNLKINYIFKGYLFVHAGINPEKSLSEQNKMEFLWSRSEQFFDKNFKFEKIVIHGHTPEKEIINFPYRINIDTGCFFSGKLSCVCLNEDNNDRKFIYS